MEHSGSAGVPPGVDASDMSAEAMQAFSEQMSGNINSIIDRQMKKMPYTHPDTFLESLEAFSAAVDWSERWIMAIGVLHVCMWVSAFATRKHYMQQFAVLSVCAAFVLGAEAVNGLGQDHWRLFASQDYFDKNGVFVTIVLSAPMLVLCFLMLLNGLYQASALLVSVKRKELRTPSGGGKNMKTKGSSSSREKKAKGQKHN